MVGEVTRLADVARHAARVARQVELTATAKDLERIAKEDEMRNSEIPFGLLAGAMMGVALGASLAVVAQMVTYAGWQLVLIAFTITGAGWGGYSAWKDQK